MKTGGGCLLGEVPLCFEDALPAIPLPHRGGEKGQGSALEGRTERAQGTQEATTVRLAPFHALGMQ